jgi:hypothetical protein
VPPAGSNRLTYLVTDGPLCTPVLQEAFVGHPRNIHDHANTTLEGLVQERNRWDSIRKDAIDAGISHQGEINFDLIRFRELGPLAAFHRKGFDCQVGPFPRLTSCSQRPANGTRLTCRVIQADCAHSA